MASGQLRTAVSQLRGLLGARGDCTLTDNQLLDNFVSSGDQASFEVLVWRHGAMVLTLCQRLLRDSHSAEDAFQATFLIFSRKAASIGKREAVASWLYKVAYRVVLRARSRTVRHGTLDSSDDLLAAAEIPDLVGHETRTLIEAEIYRLPEKYRVPVILCYLEGYTNQQAARQLNCPEGTILSRLSRARERLRVRLAGCGLSLSAAALGTILSENAASAATTDVLVSSTINAAIPYASGPVTSGQISPSVVALSEGVLQSMFLNKVKFAVVAILSLATVGPIIGLVALRALADKPAAAVDGAETRDASPTVDRTAEPIEVFRTGDELIVQLDRFDLLREAHNGLNAALKLRGGGKDKDLLIDLSDPAVKGTLVIDLSKFGNCTGMSIAVKDAAGKVLAEKSVAPIVEVLVQSMIAASPTGPLAYIEPGSAITAVPAGARLASPKIPLPDARKLRSVQIGSAKRSLSKQEITFPVISQGDAPLAGPVFLGRQTAAPQDLRKASLYVSYNKSIYAGDQLARRQKFLAEIPIQESWGKGQGDETVNLTRDVRVHLTNEVVEHWSGVPHNILGEDEGHFSSAGIDDEGRIYSLVQNRVVRFDPHTRKFECSPIYNLQKVCPGGATMKGSPGWLSGIPLLLCAHGRLFFIVYLDYDSGPNPGTDTPGRRIGGVFSIPQDWSDATAFAADTRLHVGTWETATPTLYKTPPVVGAALDERKLGVPIVTETGLLIVPAGKKAAGGPWRLDLDDQGNNTAFGEVNSLSDTVSRDGRTKFAPTQEAMINGVPKTMVTAVMGGPGRTLIKGSGTGGLDIPRASVRQLLMSDGWNASMLLPPSSKHAFRTYAGAPEGVVTVNWDIVEKLRDAPEAKGPLADSVREGPSLGPVFLVTPVPGVPDQAVAICDYGNYTLSTFDFSRIEDERVVRKTPLPARAAVPVGLGVYDSLWVEQDDEQWLYLGGYTAMSRIKYSKGGKVLDAMTSEQFHQRMAPSRVDQHARGGLKQYDRIFPVFGGRLMDSGASRSGRGGEAFGTGLELFDLKQLGSSGSTAAIPSQTAAYMSRCCGALGTLQSRMIWNAHDGSRRQEVFGSAQPKDVFVNELSAQDKALAPGNLDEKVFHYEVSEHDGLRDLFAFSLPLTELGESVGSNLALSPCQRFLVILMDNGSLYTYSIAQKQFIDGVKLKTSDGDAVETIGFRRPGENILTSPNGQLFFLVAPTGKVGASVQFNRIVVGQTGLLTIEPCLRIDGAGSDDFQDFRNCVRCFMPDLQRKDGSVDFVIGWDSKDRAQAKPFVRVIADFIPPRS